MRAILFLFLISFALLSCSTPNSESDRSPAQAELEAEASTAGKSGKVANGPYDDCDQRALFEKNDELAWSCNSNYVHIFPKKIFKRISPRKIKFGAFNLYHLGDDQGRLKDLKAVALIMDQWDIVGATEMMPLPTTYADENRKLREVLKEKGHEHLPKDWRVVEPGYYKLLKALQKLDYSWSLIFQAMPEGDGSTGELAGFYYRARRVQAKFWNYCDQNGLNDKIDSNQMGLNFGCVIRVPESQARLMSRKAFVASFKSGKFDFIAAVSHTRFRPPPAEDLKIQEAEICSRFDSQTKCAISKDKVGRFYEVKAVADQFQELEKFDKDVIYMGDFNLDNVGTNQSAWQAAISGSPGYAVYQTQNTSLSLPTQSLANSYDHFILKASALTECDLTSVRAFDFTQIGNKPKDLLLRKLSYLLLPTTHVKTIQEQVDFLQQQIRLEKVGKHYSARPLNDEEKASYEADLQRSYQRLNNNKFWVLREYLSDHVPIEMSCITSRDDD